MAAGRDGAATERGGRYEALTPPQPAPSIVMMVVVPVPAVLIPAPMATPVIDRPRPGGRHDDGRGCIALDHDGDGRSDHDRRRRHVDWGDARADEAADHTADKSGERCVAGVVAMGEGPRGERGQGRADAERSDPSSHVVTSSDVLGGAILYRGC